MKLETAPTRRPQVRSQDLSPTQQTTNYQNKFHRAALDGYVDMLCEASKRDTNQVASDHPLAPTPTLVAAHCGQLEALRILVGRGGDPERVTSHGSSALHLAAGRNQLNCVSFLVNFGVNMWALDNELHTAKDVAAMEQANEVLEYLDQVMARQSAINTKAVQKLKDKAKREAERRLKQMRKAQMKAIKQVERDERLLAKMSQNRRLLKAAHSMGDIRLVGRTPASSQPSSDVNLSPACDSTHQQQNIANYIQQRLQDDLLARTRRVRAQLTTTTTTTTPSIASTYLSSSSSSSADSTTSGYLSSCSSAKSILKSALSTGRKPSAPGSTTSGVATAAKLRPKYSDLVAVRHDELQSIKSSSTSASDCATPPLPASMFASKLRGVSRKVHLKRLLFHATGSCGQPEVLEVAKGDQQEQRLKRTRSEPDFSAGLMHQVDDDDDDDEQAKSSDEEDDQSHRSSGATCAPPPQPPPLPPAPSGSGAKSTSEQQLLTRCLSQLKVEQESATTSGSANQPPFSHSDELLQHQLKAGEFPLRPSAIKQRQHLRAAGATPGALPVGSKSATIDSIGSAGSFVEKNASESGSQASSRDYSTSSSPEHNVNPSGSQVVDKQLSDFLTANNLLELYEILTCERIDFEALLLLDESDLKSLAILLGPRRKLLAAIERHRRKSSVAPTGSGGEGEAAQAFVVVDTQF